ncbi:MAG: 6-carboxytetrahydropterin synthase [Longimicrobiales bacterium]
MPDTRLIRRVRFRAAHHYAQPGASPDENRALFGEQADSHQHDWSVEVHVVGPIDPDTGWITNLGRLDAALDRIMDGWDGGDLNERVPPVAEGRMQPSTEALAAWLYQELGARVDEPATLDRVRVFESPDLGASHPA